MRSKPKVLMFIDWYLPGYRAGGPIRSCVNLVQHLGDDLQFYIVTSDTDYQADEPYPGIERGQWTPGLNDSQVMYLAANEMNKTTLGRIAQQLEVDCIYIHGLFSSRFSILPHRFFRHADTRLIVAPRGMLRHSALQLKAYKKRPYLALARLFGWYRNSLFHATDQQELQDIRAHFGPTAEIRLAPNLPKVASHSPARIIKRAGELKLIFAGRIAPEKNLAWGLQLLHDSALEGIELNIYGAIYDADYERRCKALASAMSDRMTICFHEPVPAEEVGGLLAQHHALFLPTRGENFGHIILESFMAGRPVMISTETPWQGLERLGVGRDIPLKDTRTWTQTMKQFLQMGQEDFDQCSAQAYAYFNEYSKDPELISASKALFLPGE